MVLFGVVLRTRARVCVCGGGGVGRRGEGRSDV